MREQRALKSQQKTKRSNHLDRYGRDYLTHNENTNMLSQARAAHHRQPTESIGNQI